MTKEIQAIQKPHFQKRDEDSHKGSFGTALLVCGSYGMAGAAILATSACLKSGVGIARVALHKKIYPILTTALPEAVCLPFNSFNLKKTLKKGIARTNSILIGCGMGKARLSKRALSFLIKNAACPLIIDADGINLLSGRIDILKQAKTPIILTPHPAEFSRLTGVSLEKINANRETCALSFAKQNGVYLVLKGHNTLVVSPNGDILKNTTGNPGMATGGSGDALAGIIAALIARDENVFEAISNAVYIHGLAGDMAAKRLSETAMLPSDLIEELPCIYKMFEG